MKVAIALLALTASAVATAGDRADTQLNRTINRAIAEQGDIVTVQDRRTINVKCGLAPEAKLETISFHDGRLRCPDGRTVRDAETRALSARISTRANAVAKAALSKPEVVAAIDAYADKAAAEAVRRVRERSH